MIRDLALLVDEAVPAQALLDALHGGTARPLVQDVRLFDLYRGKGVETGKKSLAFRVVMQDTEKTLTDAEADAAQWRAGRSCWRRRSAPTCVITARLGSRR